MEKKLFTLILVVALGVAIGVGIVSKQAKAPLLREILNQQSKMSDSIARVESKVSSEGTSGSNVQVGLLTQKIQDMERRIASLESQIQLAAAGAPPAQQPQRAAPPPEDLNKVYKIDVAHSKVIGKKNASVTIVEFLDIQCPFCARFHTPLAQVIKEYPNDVKYMVKNFPLSFHPQARPAAKAAFAAGEQGKYQEMVDKLLENGRNLSEETFDKVAKDIGLNVKKFKKDYKDKDAQWEKYIEADMAMGRQVGVRGTPSFYINGRKTNARDVNSWKAEIEKELKKK